MKLRNKHIAFIGLAAIPNALLFFTIIFHSEMLETLGEAGMKNVGFFVQILASMVLVLGVSCMYHSRKSKSRFRFWTIATLLAAIPFFYHFIF